MNSAQIHDTIAAISTPPGPGGVGMVRITGPDAMSAGRKIFTPLGTDLSVLLEPKKAVVGRIHNPGSPDEPIDQAVWLGFHGPRSFTGEDTVELTAHGGPLVMRRILEAAILAGARMAQPGEFTRRAFLNGRIDLSQAEAIASLIYASTEESMKVMRRQVDGAMGHEAERLREGLLEVKVALESSIDFSEDVGDLKPDDLAGAVASVIERVQRLLDTAVEGIALTTGIRVVIAGAPNVGKSSLLNALLREDRAIVHEAAGTTRDFIEGRISVHGIPMVVVDTAGLRDEAGTLESEGIARTRNLMERADMLLLLLDGSRSTGAEELQLVQETMETSRVVALNKCDLDLHPALEIPLGAIKISALTGEGLASLKEAIHDTYTGGARGIDGMDAIVTSVRQSEALKRVLDGCSRFLGGLEGSLGPELLAVDLEDALLGIGELTGEVTVDEVLEEIFSRFCIGK
jgi:tRNA modification GTPase